MLEGLLAWVVTTIGRPMLSASVLLVAFLMLCVRGSVGMIALVAAGGLAFANYLTIAGFIGF